MITAHTQFGGHIKHLREARGQSLRALAEAAGLSATYLGKIESGQVPPPKEEKVVALAGALGEDPNDLLARAGMVPNDVRQIMGSHPQVWYDFVRVVDDAGAEGLADLWPELLGHLRHAVDARSRTRTPVFAPATLKGAQGSVVDLLNMLVQELQEGLQHGAFEIRVTCDRGTGGRREVAVRSGKLYLFTITEVEAQAFASDEAQQ